MRSGARHVFLPGGTNNIGRPERSTASPMSSDYAIVDALPMLR